MANQILIIRWTLKINCHGEGIFERLDGTPYPMSLRAVMTDRMNVLVPATREARLTWRKPSGGWIESKGEWTP